MATPVKPAPAKMHMAIAAPVIAAGMVSFRRIMAYAIPAKSINPKIIYDGCMCYSMALNISYLVPLPGMSDILGQAIKGFYDKASRHKLWIHNQYGPKEEMPIATYFRDEDDMPDLEWCALDHCRGRVLDIGAGAGSHALVLQQRNIPVTALEISPLAAQVMLQRGVNDVVVDDIFVYNNEKYDTLLLLMNGIGIAGTLDNLRVFFRHAKNLLNPDGQLLFDSSDIAYLYEGKLPEKGYYGEIAYQYEYDNQKTDWFNWLYVDEQTLTTIAVEEGWDIEVLLEDEFGQYLAQLTVAERLN